MNENRQAVLSKTQMGIYVECITFPKRTTYNLPFLCELKKDTDLTLLEQAVERVIAVHPSLDTKIVSDSNGSVCMETGAGAGVRKYKLTDAEFSEKKKQLVRPFSMNGECLSRFEVYETESENYFFYDIHHIVFDGTSVQILKKELVRAYNGEKMQEESCSVYDFAMEEQHLVDPEEYEKAKKYWIDLLNPYDLDCVPEADRFGDTPVQKWMEKEFTLDSKALKNAEITAEAPDAAVFTAAMGLLLSRYNYEDASVFSTIYNGRSGKKLSKTIGMFVKTFPFVTDTAKETETVAFLHAAAEELTESTKNTLYSYLELSADISLPGDILFAYQGKFADSDLSKEEKKIFASRERIYDDSHIEEAKLLLEVNLVSDGVYRLHLGYREDVFSKDFAEGFADAYICAVRGLITVSDIRKISLVDEKETERLDHFNDTHREYLKTPVIAQFREMAERYPEQTAVICGEECLTYRELDALSERIGAYAKSLGLGAEDVVSVLIPRGIHMASASLGAQKAGCAYQPLDATYPTERLQFMMKDAGAKLLITTKELRTLVPDYAGNVLYLEDFDTLPKTEKLNIIPAPHDLFILLYTSGTTGVPKGVQLEQMNLSAFCGWYRNYYGIDHTARVAAYASYGFDANMMDMYSALTNGATLYIIKEDMRLDFHAMNSYFCENGITHSFMTTQVGRAFAMETDCPTLRYLSVGGETLVPLELKKSGLHFINGYGPTECTIFTTAFEVDRIYKRVPIGKVLDNFKGYVLDRHGNRLPVGACGELVVAGPQVSRGYLNRPEKTAEVYMENPFCGEENYTRIYRTGDIVRYLPDGTIDIIGRNDSQIKVRGFRVELTEVEAVVRRFPGITDATVTAFDDPNGGKALAAYVVCGGKVDAAALCRFIAEEKPPYMVPAVIMQIDAIPYNHNQKVDKRVLPKPEMPKAADEEETMRPMSDLENAISEMIEEILQTKPEDVTAPLSLFGLTSISAIRLITMIYKKYGVSLEAAKVITGGSILTIENEILKAWMTKGDEVSPANRETKTDISEKEKKRSCPLTFEQQGVYVECQSHPDSTQYNLPFCMRIPGNASPDALKEALLRVVKAHPSLCSHFVSDAQGNTIMELVSDYVPKIDCKTMDKEAFAAYKEAFVRPFDLTQVPARYEIIVCDGLYLLVDIHHLIADGFSIDLFEEHLCRTLDGENIPAENTDYFTYASQQTIRSEDEAFFAQQMADYDEPSQLLPDVFEENLPHTEGTAQTRFDLKGVLAFAQAQGVTPAGVGLAAVMLTVSRYLAENSCAIATISGGRSNLQIADTIGMFVNTLAVTSHVENSLTVSEFIHQTADTLQGVIAHEHYPFAEMAHKYDFRPEISYAWQVGILVHHKTREGFLQAESLNILPAKNPISIFFEEDEKGGVIRVAYDGSMYSLPMMQSFAGCMANVIEEMQKKNTLAEISLTAEKDWEILDGYNHPLDVNFDSADTAVSRFRYLASVQPDKLAAVYKEKRYTYKELDEQTDRLAALIYRRVSEIMGKDRLAECVVSILSGRSENAFLMPLAVMKTGCAYEPLDPSYPKDRLLFMVQDAGASLLLVQDDLRDTLEEYTGETMLFSELENAPEAAAPDVSIEPKDLVIMLYTSGSTGTPKGVQIEHRNLIAFAHGIGQAGFYAGDSVTAAFASFGFDVNMADTFCTLLNGGTVHLIPEEIRMNLDGLAGYFNANGITDIMLTTQVGVQFLQNFPQMKTLRSLVVGGEKLPAVHPENLNYTIMNGYGPTENCCGVSVFPIRYWEPNIPIGKPLSTVHGYVLDKTGHRLPAGAAGEYCVSGSQVSRGYLNRPDKTKEAYEDCPFDEYRMYHTGDIVRYRQNGDVEFVGRKDGQVKIRGFRIETKEVESVIRDFPGVKDATVQAYDYETGGKYLAAFVVYDGKLNLEELRNFINERKPSYMVPSAIMQMEKIPLTVNQKVDKKALPKPEVMKADYIAPANKTEEDICRLIGSILDIEKVGAEDNFFDLGGSSISALKLVIAAENEGYEIVYQNIFDAPTPHELAALLAKAKGAEEPSVQLAAEESAENSGSYYGAGTTEIGQDGYDYSKINELLRKNTVEAYKAGERFPLENVFLLGATGYLGIHVLNELLTASDCRITCLVRPGKDVSAKDRLKEMYGKYFGSSADQQTCPHVPADVLEKRVCVLDGDFTKKESLEQVKENHMLVINCGAVVKHFSKDDEIIRGNVDSVKNLIDWCIGHDSRLVHISTESTIGNAVGNTPPSSFRFTENVFYVGQEVESNQYMYAKFLGERTVYEAILERGLNGCVIRVGNLAPRMDGQFQLNYDANSMMKGLAAFYELGFIPYSTCVDKGMEPYYCVDGVIEYSPIEYVARAVCILAQAPKECACFMASNNHLVYYGDILDALADETHPIVRVENDVFIDALHQALMNLDKYKYISELVMYSSTNKKLRMLGEDSLDNSLTMQVLYRSGFNWPVTDRAYFRNFAEKLRKYGYFV